jgi:F0F1-type ATP synthase membrane subunit b/b'
MSGIETVKVIVGAEKEATKILEDAQAKAALVRKQLDHRIQQQRETILEAAKKQAAEILRRAEEESKTEAENYEKTSEGSVRDLVTKASSKKNAAVEKLVEIVLEGKA